MKSALMIMFLGLATVNGQSLLTPTNLLGRMLSDTELRNATGATSLPCYANGTDCSGTSTNTGPTCDANCDDTTVSGQTGGGINVICIASPYAAAGSTCAQSTTSCYSATECKCQLTAAGCGGGDPVGPISYGKHYSATGTACP